MELDIVVKKGYGESLAGTRAGDRDEELDVIRQYIRTAASIIVPNRNDVKVTTINTVLREYGLGCATHLHCQTHCCDLTRMPAVTKALMALDITSCDLVIARGRLGVPGSGSMLVFLDAKGRLLTAGISPSHVVHRKPVADAVRDEMVMALERIGFTRCQGTDRL